MRVFVVAATLALGACANNFPAAENGLAAGTDHHARAVLLVSLQDGQMVMQEIDVDADVCMKHNAEPATRCFSRGAPIRDPGSQLVVAYEIETRDLELHGKTP